MRLCILAMMLCCSYVVQSSENEVVLKKLDSENVITGCSCNIRNKLGEIIASSDRPIKSPLAIKLNGKNEKLDFVSTTEDTKYTIPRGNFSRIYRNENISLTLKYKTTWDCSMADKSDESCEVSEYLIDVKIKRNSKSTTIKGLSGECGC